MSADRVVGFPVASARSHTPRPLLASFLLAWSLLPSCSTPDDTLEPERWKVIQADRLREMFAAEMQQWDEDGLAGIQPQQVEPVRLAPGYAGEVGGAEAPAATAGAAPVRRGEHIDDREPPRTPPPAAVQQPEPEDPYRAFRALGRRHGALRVGYGTVEVDLGSQLPADREPALFAELVLQPAAERLTGGGLEFSGFVTDDGLYQGASVAAFSGLAPAGAQAFGFDVFPHLAVQPDLGDRWVLPIRIGPYLGYTRLDHDLADVRRDWFDIGGRLAVEPEFTVAQGRDLRLGVFGRGGLDAGSSRYHEDYAYGEGRDDGFRWTGEAGGGLRLHGRSLTAEFAWRYRHREVSGLRSPTLGAFDEMTLTENGLFFGVSGRW